jgi:hypothetical protein
MDFWQYVHSMRVVSPLAAALAVSAEVPFVTPRRPHERDTHRG